MFDGHGDILAEEMDRRYKGGAVLAIWEGGKVYGAGATPREALRAMPIFPEDGEEAEIVVYYGSKNMIATMVGTVQGFDYRTPYTRSDWETLIWED